MKEREITATEFKAQCLALLDEVKATGETLVITKRGQPVASVQPVKPRKRKSTIGSWKDMIEIVGDIVNFNFADEWEVVREADRRTA